MRSWVLIRMATCLALLGSCASSGPAALDVPADRADPKSAAGTVDDGGAAESPTSTEPPAKSPFDYDSPIANYLGIGSGYSVEAQIRFEEAVLACMSAQGFEYTPVPVSAESFGLPTEPDGPVFGTDEWVETYGFGISTRAFSQGEVGPDLMGRPYTPSTSEEDDPNLAYRDSLPPEAQAAYDSALYGHVDDRRREPGETGGTSDTSCIQEATTEHNGGVDLQSFNQLFHNELLAIGDSVQVHPRVEAARDEASQCLSDSGLDITRFDQVEAHIDEQLMEVLAVNGPQSSDLEPGEGELSQDARDLLGQIQAEEIALAVAFRECEAPNEADNGLGDPLFIEVRIELEEQFLLDNQDRLEAFLLSGDSG